MEQSPRKYMTLEKTSQYLGFTDILGAEKARKKVYWMAYTRKIPCHKIGKEILFIQSEVDAALDEGRIFTQSEMEKQEIEGRV